MPTRDVDQVQWCTTHVGQHCNSLISYFVTGCVISVHASGPRKTLQDQEKRFRTKKKLYVTTVLPRGSAGFPSTHRMERFHNGKKLQQHDELSMTFCLWYCQYHVATWRRDKSMAETAPWSMPARTLVANCLVAKRRIHPDSKSRNTHPNFLDTAPLSQFWFLLMAQRNSSSHVFARFHKNRLTAMEFTYVSQISWECLLWYWL
jgi:hypothetical protein